MVSQSYTDCTYDSYDADNFLVSPQKYPIDANSSITFWQDWANDSYPDFYEVMVSTAANPGASDFTSIWSVGSKGQGNGAKIRNTNNRFENWTEYTVSLAAYAGQEVWIAFHHQDYDNYELWLDDVTITAGGSAPVPPTPGPVGEGQSEILWSNVIEKDMEATLTFNVSLNNAQNPDGAEVTIAGENNDYNATIADGTAEVVVRKGDTYDMTVALDGYASWNPTGNPILVEADATYDIVLQELILPVEGLYVSPTGWARWEGNIAGGGTTPTPPTPPTPGVGQWYQYGTDVVATGVGAGGAFYWGVMFPAGTYTGNMVTKAATYEMTGYGFSGTVTVYNDGATAPATAVGTMPVTVAGTTDGWAEFEFAEPLVIDPTKNLWVVFYNETSTSYPAAACTDAGDPNARWVSLDGAEWVDLALAGLSGYSWIMKVYVAEGAKGEVREISVPTQACNNAGVLSMRETGNRAAVSYKVMLDGEYLGETYYPFYQLPVEGMEEGSTHVTAVAPLYASGMGEWMEYTWTYTACDNFNGVLDFTGEAGENGTVNLSWTLPDGGTPVTPPSGNTTFTEGFEGGLNGWNVLKINADGGEWIHSDANLGGYTYTTLAHGGTGFAMCYSYVDYVGAYNTDSYMYTPQKYSIVNGSTLHFFADNANDSYPENFSVCVSTAATPASAADFTQVWSGGAKGSGNGSAAMRHIDGRYENWREHTIDLSAYAGQDVWIAFHDVNYDQYEIWIDDVELTAGTKGGRTVLYEPHFVTDPGAMSNGADASWIKGSQSTYGPGAQNSSENKVGDDFTLASASTITEIEVYGYQTGSTTTSTFTGLYAAIYDGHPGQGGNLVWGDFTTNIMTSTSFTNAYRGSDNTPTGTTRPIMALTATGLNIELEAGTYYLVWNMTGSGSSGPWAQPEAYPTTGNSGNGIQYLGSSGAWQDLADSGNNESYGVAFKLVGEGGTPTPPSAGGILGAVLFRDGEYVDFFPANVNTYTDNTANEDGGEYTYTIRVVYDGDPDVTFWAMSCGDDVTVTVQPWAVGEVSVNTLVYPNPTNGTVTIEAQGMTHITVVNTIGQVVYDADINADMTQLNLGQFNAGLYLIRINSEAGMTVERVTVVK